MSKLTSNKKLLSPKAGIGSNIIARSVFVMYSCTFELIFSKFYYVYCTRFLKGITMSEKIQEAKKYLYGCLALEKEVNILYATATKKLPCPQLSTITTVLAFDNQKHAAVIKELFKPLLYVYFSPDELPKEFKKSVGEINKLLNDLAIRDSIENDEISEVLKAFTKIEDVLHDFYAYFIESELIEDYYSALSEVSGLTSENLKYILQALKQDNSRHRDMLIESLYFYHKSEQKDKVTAPMVRYQNPDAWVLV